MRNLKLHSEGRKQNVEKLREEFNLSKKEILNNDYLNEEQKKSEIENLNLILKRKLKESLKNNY